MSEVRPETLGMWTLTPLTGSVDMRAVAANPTKGGDEGRFTPVVAGAGMWIAGWRDPVTGLIAALVCRAIKTVEEEPYLLLQSDGERLPAVPRLHRGGSLGRSIGRTGRKAKKPGQRSTIGSIWGHIEVAAPGRVSRSWDPVDSWAEDAPIIVGTPKAISVAEKAGLDLVMPLVDVNRLPSTPEGIAVRETFTEQGGAVVMVKTDVDAGSVRGRYVGLNSYEVDLERPVASVLPAVAVDLDEQGAVMTGLVMTLTQMLAPRGDEGALAQVRSGLQAERNARQQAEKDAMEARGQAAATASRLEAAEASIAALRKREAALERALREATKEEAEGEEEAEEVLEDQDDSPALTQPVPVPEEVTESGSFTAVGAWASRALPGLHIEAEALVDTDALEKHRRARKWVRAYAQSLAVLDGWARAKADGWEGNVKRYADLADCPIDGTMFGLAEGRFVRDNDSWAAKRVRPCCPAVADPDGTGTHSFEAHARIGGSQHPAPRAHFDMGADGRVHVAYVGPHLPTMGTQRSKQAAWR